MKNKFILGGAILGTCLIVIFAFAKFAASANNANKTPAVLQALTAAPPMATQPSSTPAAAPAAAVKADAPRDFDDWRLLCETPAQGKKQCNVFQRITWGKDAAQPPALTTVMHPAQLKDKPATGMRLITPLGTVLTPGMAIKIDDGKDIKVPFTQCLPGGCLVDVIFDQDMLGKMRAGKSMFVAYRLPNGKDNTLKVSLKGLAPALDAMAQSATKG